jgi:hypothetical protein
MASGNGTLRMFFGNTDNELEIFSINQSYPTGWIHLAYTFSCPDMTNCTAQGYLNGSPVTTTKTADQIGSRRADTGYTFFHGDQPGGITAMDGRMRLAKIWTEQLDSGEVAALFAQDVCDPE